MRNLITIASFFIINVGFSQFFDFNNRHLSQSHLLNPAFMPQYKATLSTGQTYLSANLIGTTLNGLFGSNETPIQTVTRMIGEDEKQLGADLFQQSDVFHFGFRSKKSYFSLNSSIISEGSIRLPKDLFGLVFLGNGAFIDKDADIDFSGNRFRSYLKNTFSYGRFLSNELSVGVNASFINGISDLDFEQAKFGLGTDTGTFSVYSLRLNGAIKGRASLLGIDVQDALNDSNFNAEQAILDQLNKIQINSNQGYALGFGAVYRINEKFRFSFAVQNIGNITWNLGAQEIKMNGTDWTWNGLDTNQIGNINNDIVKQIQDTLLNKFDITGSNIESYTTQLKPRYILGAEFMLMPRTRVQAFGGYGFGLNGDKTFMSTTLHQELGEWVDLRVGYSVYDLYNPAHRVGLGLSFNLGPLQLFGSVDNLLSIVSYGTTQVTSGTFGVNFNIGSRKDRDYDEVPDKRDSCYKTYGVISNNGCPYGFLGSSMTYSEEENSAQELEIESVEAEVTEFESPEVMELEKPEDAPAAETEETLTDEEMMVSDNIPTEEVTKNEPTVDSVSISNDIIEIDSNLTYSTDTTRKLIDSTGSSIQSAGNKTEVKKEGTPSKPKSDSKAIIKKELEELMKR